MLDFFGGHGDGDRSRGEEGAGGGLVLFCFLILEVAFSKKCLCQEGLRQSGQAHLLLGR